MRPLPIICGVLTAATIGAGGFAPSAGAATEVDLHAALSHSKAFPRATGHSEYKRGFFGRDVEVTVRHIPSLAGTRVTVFVNLQRVGSMRVNSSGIAHREWDSDRGQFVPRASAGDPVRVRTATGTLVASGRYQRGE